MITRAELKALLVAGAKPQEQTFHDWVDSIVFKSDDLKALFLKYATQIDAEAGTDNEKIMTALRVRQAIDKAVVELKGGVSSFYDTLKEIEDYIGSDKSVSTSVALALSDRYTKSEVDTELNKKLNISSIVNDLTTGGAAVPLSAEQGKNLNKNIATSNFHGDFPLTPPYLVNGSVPSGHHFEGLKTGLYLLNLSTDPNNPYNTISSLWTFKTKITRAYYYVHVVSDSLNDNLIVSGDCIVNFYPIGSTISYRSDRFGTIYSYTITTL